MHRYLQKIASSLATSIAGAPISSDDRTRLQHYSVFVLLGIPTMLGYGIYHILKANYLLFALIFLSAAGLAVGWLFLRRLSNGRPVYRINVMLFVLLILYMLLVGGEGGSKILWMYTFPLISFFLFGKHEGLFWCALVFIVGTMLLVIPSTIAAVYDYPDAFVVRFAMTYLIVSAVTYWYEDFRFKYRVDIELKNNNLMQEVAERISAEKEREKLIVKLQAALGEVKTLSGFLPICASCKKIRDDKGYWNQIESYIRDHSGAKFTHGICPECAKKMYSGFLGGNKKTTPE